MAAARIKNTRKRTAKSVGTSRRRIKPNRPQTVWMALVASMVVATGVLFALDRKPAIGSDGVAILPLMATTSPNSVEVILNTRTAIANGRWKSIVIHSSGSPLATQASLDSQAHEMGLRGIGYHFVIGNGNGMGDGELFVTDRWLSQSNGAHVSGNRGDELNKQSIGICLVGDGEHQKFTQAQLSRLVQVIDTLSRELNIPTESVHLHSDVAPVSSPGRLFPAIELRKMLASRK